MMKKCKAIMFILCLITLLTGCWDYNDLNKRSVILANGIDQTDGKIEFTGEIAKLASKDISAGEKTQINSTYTNIASGKYFEDARVDYNSQVPEESFLGAQRVLVFSYEYAKNGIKTYINRAYNSQESRSSALTTVCKEPTNKFFSGMVENDISIGYGVEDTVRYLSNNGAALYKTIQEINSDIYFSDIGYLLPYITKNEDTIEYLGLAVMKDSKLVGTVDKKESGGFLFVLSDKASSILPIPHPSNKKNIISVKSVLKKRRIKTSYEDDGINIYIDLKLASQMSYLYKVESISEEDTKKLEEIVCKKVKQDIISAVERSKNEFKCDVFGFGKFFKSQNILIYREIQWKEEYLNAKFHVNVTAKITNTNLIDTNAKEPD